MTHLALTLEPHRAVVLADSLILDGADMPNCMGVKVLPVPRHNAVVAGRGDMWALDRWAQWWLDSPSLSDAVAGAEYCAREIVAAYRKGRPDRGACEFVSLAWDGDSGRVVGFLNLPDYDFRTIALRDGTHSFPWVPGYPTRDRKPLVDVIRDQWAGARDVGEVPRAAGPWVRTVLTRRGVSIRAIGSTADLGLDVPYHFARHDDAGGVLEQGWRWASPARVSP